MNVRYVPAIRLALPVLLAATAAGAIEPTTVTIVASGPNPSEFGQGIAVTATVSSTAPGTPGGTLTIGDGVDACTVSLPRTTCLYRPTTSGDKTLTASYSGDANFAAGTSSGVAHRVAAETWPRRVSLATAEVNLGTTGGITSARSASSDMRFIAFTSDARSFIAGDTVFVDDVFVLDRLSGRIETASRGLGGARGNGASNQERISADGRFVVFSSTANNLVAGDTNSAADVFVYDREGGGISLVSIGLDGVPANATSTSPAISGDGRYVAFASSATNLVIPAPAYPSQIFVRDRLLNQTRVVSVDSGGVPGNSQSSRPAISADGRHVGFESFSTNLVAGDTNATTDVFVHALQTGITERVSVSGAGMQANSDSHNVTFSADGSVVAFESYANNLVPNDTGGSDVFVRNQTTGAIVRASVSPAGTGGNGYSYWPSLSADGRYVVFASEANNLVGGDGNGDMDVFRRDLLAGTTTRVSVSSSGAESDADSSRPFLSADGRYVLFNSEAWNLDAIDRNAYADPFLHDTQEGATQATVRIAYGTQGAGFSAQARIDTTPQGRFLSFVSRASNLVPGDFTPLFDVFVRHLDTGATQRINVTAEGGQADSDGYRPRLSADGRHVAFYSDATNLAGNAGNAFALDVFLRDRQTGTTELVSVGNSGEAGNHHSAAPELSADGRFVVFQSLAGNLAAGDTNTRYDIFLRDRTLQTTQRLSVSTAGAQGNGDSIVPSISDDAAIVAFSSQATTLVAGDTNVAEDVFVRDVAAATTQLISKSPAGGPGNGASNGVDISSDGRYVVFSSTASNLVAGDTNGFGDVFVYDRSAALMQRVSVSSTGIQGNSLSDAGSISADGRYVVFSSMATNLVAGDSNGVPDAFVHDRQTATTVRLSVDAGGTQGNGQSDEPQIDADGRFIVFRSDADNLVAGDSNGESDVFLVRNPLFLEATTTQIIDVLPASSVVGQPYSVGVAVSSGIDLPGGSVGIGDGNTGSCTAPLSNGTGACTLVSSGAGTLTLSATYAGGAGHAGSMASRTHVVAAASTSLSLSAPGSAVSGQPLTLTAVIGVDAPGAGTPTGTVEFLDGSSVIASAPPSGGSASATVTLAGGTHTLSARYPGNANYLASTASPLTFVVQPAVALQVTLDDSRRFVAGGSVHTYTLVVRNDGPDAADGAVVRNVPPANLVDMSFTCSVNGASCGAGSGAIVETVNLPANSERTYLITGTVAREPEQPLVHGATVQAPANVVEIDGSDNSASDTTNVGIFADGFQSTPAGD